jgi:hypothetical protein
MRAQIPEEGVSGCVCVRGGGEEGDGKLLGEGMVKMAE